MCACVCVHVCVCCVFVCVCVCVLGVCGGCTQFKDLNMMVLTKKQLPDGKDHRASLTL